MFSILIAFSIFILLPFQAQTQNTCANSLCNDEAVCSLAGGTPVCECVPKFFQGDTCKETINNCDPNPCQNNGVCQPYLGHYFCECTDGFFGQTCSSTKDIFVGLHLHYNHIAEVGKEQTFLLTVQSRGSVDTDMDFFTPDYVIDGGSFSSATAHFKAHGSLSSLASSLNLRHSETMPYEKGFYRISHGTFWKLGVQELNLDLVDDDTSESFFDGKFNLLVYDPTGQLCLPVIQLPNCQDPHQSLHIDIVTFNFVEPIVDHRCSKSSSFKIKWTVRNYIDSVVLHTFPDDPWSSLTIPPYTMWFDFRDDYLQSYVIQGDVTELDSGGDVVAKTVVRCYVFVETKNTQAKIIGGPDRKVNVGRSFEVDGSLSRDYARRPSGPQHLKYKWSCTSDDATTSYCSAKMGKAPKLSIPANALKLGSTYQYKLVVQSTINIFSTNVAVQSIQPVAEDPLLLNFKCLRNCQQDMFAAGKLVHLKVECLDCSAGEVAYSIQDGDGAEVSTSYRFIMAQAPQAEISLAATATQGQRKGSVSAKLKVNNPPANGKCVVSPTSGVEFLTVFEISCTGYVDLQSIMYRYQVGAYNLDYSGRNKLTTRLFASSGQTSDITVSICDELEACTEQKLQVSLNPLTPAGSWLEFLKEDGSDLKKIAAAGDRLAVNALLNAIIPHMPADEGLEIAEFMVSSLGPFEVTRLLVVEQVLKIARQLFDTLPLSSKSAGLVSKLFARVAEGFEHSIRSREVFKLDLDTHTRMLDDVAQAMSKESTEAEVFPSTIHTAEIMPPEDPFAEDYPDYGEFDVDEVVSISNWFYAFTEMHRCLQLLGVVSSCILLPEEPPILIKKDGLTSKTLVMDTFERASLSLSDMETFVQLPSNFLDNINEKKVAIQFSVFELNPLWWFPDQYEVRTAVLSLSACWKCLYSLFSQSATNKFTFRGTLKKSKQPDDLYVVKGHVKGSLDMPVYAKILPPNAVLTVKFSPPDGELQVLLAVGKRPRSHMLNQAHTLNPSSASASFTLVNQVSEPNTAYVAFAADAETSFTFTMYVRLCLTWDPVVLDWTSEYCSVGKETDEDKFECTCSHLSLFAVKEYPTFAILQPGRDILKELTFSYTLTTTYILTVLVLLLFLFVAWRRDLNASRGAVVLNTKTQKEAPYKYLITVYTNGHAFASTSSSITIQLKGAIQCSPKYTLYASCFTRNSQASFVLYRSSYLGGLKSVFLHHDSFGRSPSWNCHSVRVRDDFRDEEYLFRVGKWLSHHESTSCSAAATLMTKFQHNSRSLILRDTVSSEYANWYSQQVFHPPRLFENLSTTEKTAIFIVRVCVILIGTMIVFGPTTLITYEEERKTYYYMLLDFTKLFPIVFLSHMAGLVVALGLRYVFIRRRTRADRKSYELVFYE